jgi:hypothetical protein
MFHLARSLAVSRLLAALVALGMTGGMPLIEGAPQDEAAHRCHCHHGPGELCICSRCQRSATAAQGQASDQEIEKLPPCHQAAARAARTRSEPAPGTDAPMLTGCCGSSVIMGAMLATAQPFVVPPALGLAAPSRNPRPLGSANLALDLTRTPPTPPPRLA